MAEPEAPEPQGAVQEEVTNSGNRPNNRPVINRPTRHALALTAAVAILLPACGSTSRATTPTGPPPSRAWIANIENYVKADKPTPPGAARLYAYVAKAYGETRATESVAQANEVARRVAATVLPNHVSEIDAFATTIAKPVPTLSKNAQAVADTLIARSKTDNWQADNNATAMATAPVGPGYWVKTTAAGPFAPSAGSWQRWLVPQDANFAVPPPPAYDSAEFNAQLTAVANAARARDAQWVSAINYWGGVPGTEGPSGIWLNQLWKRVQTDAIAKDDKQYARTQAVLAQTLADAFMECWKVKYTYWTARPDMVNPLIKTAMANPPFPGYVSGHSTISSAAATVLGVMVPAHKDAFLRDAQEARDSRLYAGIHYPVDNEQGFALGIKVGDAALTATKNGAHT